MAILKCPECANDVSDKALTCPQCGTPIMENKTSYETESYISDESTRKNTIAVIIGIILEVMALVVFFSFNGEYIDKGVKFGGDFNTYTYQTLVYIATALRYGLSGILIGIGALLQCSRTATYHGRSTTTLKRGK